MATTLVTARAGVRLCHEKSKEDSMKSEHYDLIAIGAGSAARGGANKAAKDYRAKVALIEGERWGGSCPNVACVPTKDDLVAADPAPPIKTLAEGRGIEVGAA